MSWGQYTINDSPEHAFTPNGLIIYYLKKKKYF